MGRRVELEKEAFHDVSGLKATGYRLQATGCKVPAVRSLKPVACKNYFGENGCFAVLAAATTSWALGLLASARWIASLVAR